MKPLGMAATATLATLDSQRKSEHVDLPIRRVDPRNLPAVYDRHTDFEIPRRVWSAIKIDGQPRAIRRELTDEECEALKRRVGELEPAFVPCCRPNDDDEMAVALLDMFSGFPAARGSDHEIAGKVDSAMRILTPFPLWSIVRTCARIRMEGYEIDDDKGARRERHWPPSDSEIVSEIRKTIKLRFEALESARALLSAEVER